MYREAVIERFIKPLDRPADAYVGVELEFPIVNLAKRAVESEVVQRAAENFARAFSFAELRRDANGAVFFAGDEKTGDSLSFDCSYNTLEWSFGRERDIRVLDVRFRAYFSFLQKELAAHRHILTGMGINPYYKLNRREPVANGRYRMLYPMCGRRAACRLRK